MKQFFANIVENLTFVLEFVGIVAVLVLVALIAEKLIARRNGEKGGSLTARKTATIGMFAAIAGVLMTIEVPMPLHRLFMPLMRVNFLRCSVDLHFIPWLACSLSLSRSS